MFSSYQSLQEGQDEKLFSPTQGVPYVRAPSLQDVSLHTCEDLAWSFTHLACCKVLESLPPKLISCS